MTEGFKTFSLGYVGKELEGTKHAIYDFDEDILYIKDPRTYNAVALSREERELLKIILMEL